MEIPLQYKRNEFGLKELPAGQEYKFTLDGRVSWKDMIPKEYLVINKSYENQIVEKLGKPLSEVSIDEVEDHQKLSLLEGSRHLLDLRGFTKLKYSQPVYGANGSVSVECEITFVPNFETEMREMVFSGVGEATMNNATPIGKNKLGEWAYFLAATAQNRSFVTCLRKALRIPILSKEEAQFETTNQSAPLPTSGIDPHSMLKGVMDSKKPKINFEILKKTIIGHYKDKFKKDPEEWNDIKDIPANDVFTIIGLLKQDKKTGVS